MKAQIETGVSRRKKVMLLKTTYGFSVNSGSCELELKKTDGKSYDVYEEGKKIAILRRFNNRVIVTNLLGEAVITVNDVSLEHASEEECCEVVAKILVRWVEK